MEIAALVGLVGLGLTGVAALAASIQAWFSWQDRRAKKLESASLPKDSPSTQSQSKVGIFYRRTKLSTSKWNLSAAEGLVRDFVDRSPPDVLAAIDVAIVNWLAPPAPPDSNWGWRGNQDIDFKVGNLLRASELPKELVEIGGIYRQKHPKEKDGIKYCVVQYALAPEDKDDRLLLTVRPITWLTSYPVAEALATGLDPEKNSIRKEFFYRLENRAQPLRPNMLVAHIIVTLGNKFLLTKRRIDDTPDYEPAYSRSSRGTWSASIEEHFNAPRKDEEGYPPKENIHHKSLISDFSIFQGLHRALEEELRLSQAEREIVDLNILAAGFEYHNFNTALYVIAKLPSSMDENYISLLARENPEIDAVKWSQLNLQNLEPVFVDGSPPKDLAENLAKDELQEWTWNTTSRMRIALAIGSTFGINEYRKIIAHYFDARPQ